MSLFVIQHVIDVSIVLQSDFLLLQKFTRLKEHLHTNEGLHIVTKPVRVSFS